MNSLLKRQIRKYLSEVLKDNEDLAGFLTSVDRSYDNFDEQSSMIQRAMSISSDELYDANRKLQAEGKEQKELIDKQPNPKDKRGLILELTITGKLLLAQCLECMDNQVAPLLTGDLSVQEIEQLSALLKRLLPA